MAKNSKKNIAATTLAVFLATASGVAFADAQEEINKQVAKLIGDAISTRVATRALDSAALGQRPTAAEKNTLWGSYTQLRVDVPALANFRSSLFVAGYDRDLTDSIIFGAAASYSETNNAGGHSQGISPYLTYMFNKNIFGIVRLDYSEFSGGGFRAESYGTSASINGVYRSGDLVARGRGELGTSRTDAGIGGTTNTTIYSGDGELGYYFTPSVYGHVGLQLSETNRSNTYQASARVGLETMINKNAAVSLKYERKVDDNAPGQTVKIDSITAAVRIRF